MSVRPAGALASGLLDTLRSRRRGWKGATPRLRGGLALRRDKPGLERPIVALTLPPELVLPLVDHRRRELAPQVVVGQRVARGERLAPGVLASAAGTVVAIAPHRLIHPSGLTAPCVRIATERPGERTAPVAPSDGHVPDAMLPPLERASVERLLEGGVGGLGGAGFSTAGKLLEARERGVHTLLVNGAECEPGIACDEALMRVAAADIVAGAHDLAVLLGCERIVVALESDKREAARSMRAAADVSLGTSRVRVELVEVAPVYPSGAERLLAALVCGTPRRGATRPTAHGVLCVNVATARAAYRARLGEPMLSRIVSVGGALAAAPCNVSVALGTPVSHVLAASGQGERGSGTRLRAGGPLSGFDLDDDTAPVTATTNRLALEPPAAAPTPLPCIRCAACSEVCPVALLPQELLRHARADDDAALVRGGLDACIECGCCDVVCPSTIPLTASFRHARGRLAERRERTRDAAAAEERHRRRTARLARRAAGPNPPYPPSERSRPGTPSPEAPVRTEPATGEATSTADAASSGAPDERAPTTRTPVDPVAAALERARRRAAKR